MTPQLTTFVCRQRHGGGDEEFPREQTGEAERGVRPRRDETPVQDEPEVVLRQRQRPLEEAQVQIRRARALQHQQILQEVRLLHGGGSGLQEDTGTSIETSDFRSEDLLQMRNITRRHTRFDRIKRAPLRLKRDALDHVETAMKDVQGKLTDLKNANASLIEPNLATNTISEGGAGCVIINQGRVNCSTVIYQDRKSWRQSRHMIDNEIYQLKQKLEKLKEIRRHLKHTKPISGQADEDEDAQWNKTLRLESPEVNELSVPLEQEYGLSTEQYHPNTTKTKRKRKRPHDAEPQKPLKRPRVRAEGETTEGGARVELTTSGPYFGHSNPHRHHKYFGTTRDEVFSTVVPPSVRRRTTTPSTTTTPTTTTTPKVNGNSHRPFHNFVFSASQFRRRPPLPQRQIQRLLSLRARSPPEVHRPRPLQGRQAQAEGGQA
jgi:hypothetical protein